MASAIRSSPFCQVRRLTITNNGAASASSPKRFSSARRLAARADRERAWKRLGSSGGQLDYAEALALMESGLELFKSMGEYAARHQGSPLDAQGQAGLKARTCPGPPSVTRRPASPGPLTPLARCHFRQWLARTLSCLFGRNPVNECNRCQCRPTSGRRLRL